MPIYLPPLSRRRFLKRTLAVGAGLLVGNGLPAREEKAVGESWALLSDIHIAANTKTVAHGVNLANHLTTASQQVMNWPERPQGVLISGDLAFNSGEIGDYDALARLLTPLRKKGFPIHLALGNHDHRERFWKALHNDKSVQRSLSDKQISVVRSKYVNWFILDSLLQTVHTPGALGDAQRHWLADALDKNWDKPALIVIHHNPSFGYQGALDDTTELFEILRPRDHVKAFFFGHSHRWDVAQDESGIHLINLPPVAYLFEPHRPCGWVHVTINDDSALLNLRCLDGVHKQHGEKTRLDWRERA